MILLAVLLTSLAQAPAAAQTPIVQWSGDRLTVQAVNAPLRTLLEEVAARTGIVLNGAEHLAGRDTVDIRDAYLSDALKTLLANVNFAVMHQDGRVHLRIHSMTMSGDAPPPKDPISIPGLTDRVVARQPAGMPPTKPAGQDDPETEEERREKAEELTALDQAAKSNEDDSLQQIAERLASDHSEVRIRALHLLAARGDEPDAVEEIGSAFADHDAEVVSTAANLLASIPGSAALEAIENYLSPENSPELQLAAIRSLAVRADILSLPAVRRAAREEGPVRELAERLVKALEERAGVAAKTQGR